MLKIFKKRLSSVFCCTKCHATSANEKIGIIFACLHILTYSKGSSFMFTFHARFLFFEVFLFSSWGSQRQEHTHYDDENGYVALLHQKYSSYSSSYFIYLCTYISSPIQYLICVNFLRQMLFKLSAAERINIDCAVKLINNLHLKYLLKIVRDE